MSDSFEEFKLSLQRFNDKTEKQATARLRRISMKALSMIVTSTPVLTGCCRANWIVSIGDLSKSFDPKKKDLQGGETIKSGLARLESAKLGIDVLIENSCPYVMRLENGWSRQAPPGCMVRNNLAKLQTAINKGAH